MPINDLEMEAVKSEEALLQVEKIEVEVVPVLFIRGSMETGEGEW